MRHLDLFSGIGGFALAADRVFVEVEHIFCEIDLFCQAVLRKHYPHSKIYGDIRDFIAYAESGKSEKQTKQKGREDSSGRNCDLLTGGFPCQPFSQAGRRRGTRDDRYLWGEMFRVIQLTKPKWVIAENVRGLLTIQQGVVFQKCISDLERENYTVQTFIIPAVAVNAPHRRDRVWIIAQNTNTERGTERESEIKVNIRHKWNTGARDEIGVYRKKNASNTSNNGCDRNDTESGMERKIAENKKQFGDRWTGRSKRCDCNVSNSAGGRCRQCVPERQKEDNSDKRSGREEWKQNWLEVATRLCRVDDGLPKRMDRNPRLKALGNAIVPQVAEEIMRAISRNDW